MHLLPYDLHLDRITDEQAAELAGVSVQVIRNWASRGYHDATAGRHKRIRREHGDDGRARYYGIDVLRAEAATRTRARRRLASSA